MIVRCIRLTGFLCFALLSVSLMVPASHADSPESPHDPSYEPYAFDSIRFDPPHPGMQSILTKLRVLPGRENRADSIILVRAINRSPNQSSLARFSVYYFPDWLILDEDPVPFTILDWTIFRSKETGEQKILAGGCTDTTVMVRVESPQSDSPDREQLVLYRLNADSGWDSWHPFIFMEPVGDIDGDDREEVLIYSSELRQPRILWCVQTEPLQIKWKLNMPSLVTYQGLYVVEEGGEKRIVTVTGNPNNGQRDSLFSDQYGYYVVLDAAGKILTRKVIICNYQQRGILNVVRTGDGENDKLYLVHSLSPSSTHDCDTVTSNPHFVSRIDGQGKLVKSAPLPGNPTWMWIDNRAPDGGPAICVWMTEEILNVYDTSLTLLESRQWKLPGRYLGRMLIPGHDDSVEVFSSGIYDHNLTDQLLTFPLSAYYWEPITTDSLGRVIDIMIGNPDAYYVGRIRKKSSIELASVFYHRNQIYVLMLLSGLLVGLVVVNIYRHKTKSNLQLISQQKAELERTHEELKAAQIKLVATEKYRQAQDIAGGFAHEIRNALFPADGALLKLHELSGNGDAEDSRRTQYCEHARRAVQRAIDLTKTISSYTKLEATSKTQAFSLRDLIDGVIDANRLRVESAGAVVVNEVAPDVTVSGVRQQLEIVFNNLLLNAVDAAEGVSAPQVSARASVNKDVVAIEWSDNGMGIREDNKSRIFEPFFTTKPPTGTGLGLAIVKRIVDLHGGTIRVESTESQGTTFYIQLPVTQETSNA